MKSYVKAVNADVVSAMTKLEEQFLVPQLFPASPKTARMSLN